MLLQNSTKQCELPFYLPSFVFSVSLPHFHLLPHLLLGNEKKNENRYAVNEPSWPLFLPCLICMVLPLLIKNPP